MGFYFRKSKKIGPLKINFSNSGIGLSTGIKGTRISVNSKGTYINLGRNGLYYREKIGNGIPRLKYSNMFGCNNTTQQLTQNSNKSNLQIINNANSQFIVSSNEQSIIDINNKIKSSEFAPKIILIFSLLSFFFFFISFKIFIFIFTIGSIISIAQNIYENNKKTSQLFYDLDIDAQNQFNDLDSAFDDLSKTEMIWHVNVEQSQNPSSNNKFGLELLSRRKVEIFKSMPPFIETNLEIWCINLESMSLYFFPERLLIFNNQIFDSIQYCDLKLKYTDLSFSEREIVSRDAQIIGKTYKHVNNDGSPDKRFANNPEVPLINYGLIKFYSSNGLNISLMVSNKINAEIFFAVFNKIST